jgi:hypothetical protein
VDSFKTFEIQIPELSEALDLLFNDFNKKVGNKIPVALCLKGGENNLIVMREGDLNRLIDLKEIERELEKHFEKL